MSSQTEGDARGAERSKTRIFATVSYYQQKARGRVIDLSATGVALELDDPLDAAANSPVQIDSIDLGHITGTVIWNHGKRIGIKLELSTNTLAQISSYFRFFHQEIKPTIER